MIASPIRWYALHGHELVPIEGGLEEWAKAMSARFGHDFFAVHVGDDVVGDVRISTVFLGIDLSYGRGPARLFETMVFGGPLDRHQERYPTWDEAAAGHAAMLARIKALKSINQGEAL
jgi:hypothetical protein